MKMNISERDSKTKPGMGWRLRLMAVEMDNTQSLAAGGGENCFQIFPKVAVNFEADIF